MQLSSDGRKPDAMSPTGFTGSPYPFSPRRFPWGDRFALEMVWSWSILALLHAHRADDQVHGCLPSCVERLHISRCFPVPMRQPDGVAQRVQLVLSLEDAGAHFRLVAMRRGCGQVRGKRVRVRVDQQASRLPPDHSLQQCAQTSVLCGQRQVRPHLRGRIPQPHGRDVPRYYRRIWLAFKRARQHRRIERVREANFQTAWPAVDRRCVS